MPETKLIISKITGTRRLTETQIKNLGARIFVTQRWKYWIALLLISVAWFVIAGIFFTNTMSANIIGILPLFLIIVAFVYSYVKAGSRLWNKVKDLEEPIEIK